MGNRKSGARDKSEWRRRRWFRRFGSQIRVDNITNSKSTLLQLSIIFCEAASKQNISKFAFAEIKISVFLKLQVVNSISSAAGRTQNISSALKSTRRSPTYRYFRRDIFSNNLAYGNRFILNWKYNTVKHVSRLKLTSEDIITHFNEILSVLIVLRCFNFETL